MTTRTLPHLLCLLTALAAAGCGSDDDQPRATPTATASATALPSPSATLAPAATATAVPSATATLAPTAPATAADTATATATATVPTPTATSVPLTSAQVLAPGPYGVGVTTITFVDASRPTMPNKDYPGAPNRTLATEIWYPAAAVDPAPAGGQRDAALLADGAPYPLVVYSHGFIDRRTSGGFLARHLASHGYVVLAIDYPLSNGNAPGGPTVNDVANQPGDISYVLDQVLADDPGNRFAGAIDAGRIGLTGLSLGGLTSTLTAFHANLRDMRVRAVAPIAGLACNFNDVFYGDLDIPLLTVHGDIDAILPFAANARTQFDNANSPRYLVTVVGASHTAFSELGALINVNNQDDVGCVALGSALPDPGDTTLLDALGGAPLGVVENDCPLPCQDPTPRPTALRGARQLDLTVLAVYPFLEAYLRDNAAMRLYLETTLAAENGEIVLESELP